jgi:hypothetical protein
MPSGPNLDLYSVFYEYSEGEGHENMKISRHVGIGDIETHTDRPRYFWKRTGGNNGGIGAGRKATWIQQ